MHSLDRDQRSHPKTRVPPRAGSCRFRNGRAGAWAGWLSDDTRALYPDKRLIERRYRKLRRYARRLFPIKVGVAIYPSIIEEQRGATFLSRPARH